MKLKNYTLIACLFILNFIQAQTVVFNDNFENDQNNWSFNSDEFEVEVKKGQLIIENKHDKNNKWTLQDIINNADDVDFDIYTEIEVLKASKDYNNYGLVWSCYRNNKYYRVVSLTPDKQNQVYYYKNGDFDYSKSWAKTDAVKGFKKINKIKIEKRVNVVKIYINGELVEQLGGISYYGSKIGFIISAKTKIAVHQLKVTTYEKEKIDIVDTFDPNLKIEKVEALSNPDIDEVSPKVSADGKILYLAIKDYDKNIGSKRDDIWYATKDENNNWTPYKNFGEPLNNKDYNYVVSISPDNNTLVVGNEYSSDGKSCIGPGISITNKTANGWEIPKAVAIEDFKNVNRFSEYFLSNSKKQLLMTVERPGDTYGGKDLYVSFKKDDGSWGKPLNLGNTLNTFSTESFPFLASDGKTLYFSSKGHYGYGGHDLFVTKRLDDSWTNWSKPKNLGPVINSTSGDMSIFLTAKGDKAYVGKDQDIYVIDNSVEQDPVVLVKGTVYDAKTKKVISTEIIYNDLETNNELGNALSDPVSGSYSIILPFGKKYSFMADKKDYYAVTENVDLSQLKAYKEITVDLYLNPIEKGQTIRLNNIFFDSGKYELLAESNAELDKLFNILKDNKNLVIEIAGHTDAVGNEANNLTLSKNRANAVMNYLSAKGIPTKQLTAKGYGETKFIATNDTEEGKQLNRRVEFEIKEL